jgi:hypothetical protein
MPIYCMTVHGRLTQRLIIFNLLGKERKILCDVTCPVLQERILGDLRSKDSIRLHQRTGSEESHYTLLTGYTVISVQYIYTCAVPQTT